MGQLDASPSSSLLFYPCVLITNQAVSLTHSHVRCLLKGYSLFWDTVSVIL